MKILINTASTFKGGGVQVAYSFIEECKNYPEHQYHIVLGTTIGKMIKRDTFPQNFRFYKIGYRPATKVFSIKGAGVFFEELEAKVKPDVVFTTSGPAYWRPLAPHLAGYNLPHYIYTDSPFISSLPLLRQLKWKIRGAFIKYFFKRDADAYVVQTDDVNERLRAYLGTDKVYTVTNTFSSKYLNPKQVDDKLPARQQDEFRMLTLSAWYPHKNIGIIKPVIDILLQKGIENIRFVLTLPDEVYREHFPEKYREYIYNVGVVKIDEAPALYKECDAMFLPTLLECFSASYAEAMKMDVPVLTSDMGFAHTVCNDAAVYFNPIDPADIADKIIQLTASEDLRKSLVAKGKETLKNFGSADVRAKKYLELLTQLADGGKD
jgi:glycosyltransferase involved in cell wall biosynthesis